VFVAAVMVAPACRSNRQAEPKDAAESVKAPVLDKALIEQLNAIGYLSGTSPAGPHSGVRVHNEALAQKGYSFFTSGHALGVLKDSLLSMNLSLFVGHSDLLGHHLL
jgi:hypothetical protein